jgi:hypothetical protein
MSLDDARRKCGPSGELIVYEVHRPGLVSRDLDLWAYQRGVTLTSPGRQPTDTDVVE